MEDDQIIDMYINRDENAVAMTESKYEVYCRSVASRILSTREDTDEALNDTWLAAWNAIPPHKPNNLRTFLAKLTRNISLNKVRSAKAMKRGPAEVRVVFEEIEEWLRSCDDTEQKISEQAVAESINGFLDGISETERNVFIRRYWYMQPISEIADYHGFSESKVKSMLFRMRKKLYSKMEKEELI
ncbi:RNA polymerase sigma factor [Ruminococcus albus]|uniref:RNA polymerase sigma-70 factor, ECF subfamily n=1 Tax=Ruminococcus albus TaxID=1264 RepID=A0A1I1F5L6_RUMAL|nr:sigma-70 family RNA polymerase sigma factor [Ruminococcus albus]SFB94232.1 RNA polymerase sigma-70 factor, ECF subfamily [Ruminococcus albus]